MPLIETDSQTVKTIVTATQPSQVEDQKVESPKKSNLAPEFVSLWKQSSNEIETEENDELYEPNDQPCVIL